MTKKQRAVTIEDLRTALSSGDLLEQFDVFESYSHQRPTIEALPFLRRALRSKRFSVVKCAAISLQKLGQHALPAARDLRRAAYTIDKLSDIPTAYPQCLHALVAIVPEDEEDLLEMISHFTGITNWEIVSSGMSALQKLGTPKALDLLRRIHTFWYSDLNKTQQKAADKFLKPLK